MAVKDETQVGKKGEILPKLPLRKESGISPGDRVIIEARPGELRIRKILDLDEVFSLPPITSMTPEEIEQILAEEGISQEELSDS